MKELKGNFAYLLHPFPAFLITSISKEKKPNVMTASWLIPLSTNPPLIVLSLKPERYTYSLIKETGDFAINIPPYELRKATLICGRYSGRNTDKFRKANLTPILAEKIASPLIKECIAHVECTIENIVDIKADHHLVIGRVLRAQVIKEYFDKTYLIEKFKPTLYFGNDLYGTITNIEQLYISDKEK
ncbi:MAG TPA: flavin reductase family protein [Dictyoglomaceae bacterium]|nr:flavin reductase family protein [Dictyoglomaceae bacterium]HOL39013.1 flavin reductase family protein [Dictyoglomaceae bacterium]HOP94352.1 flavin reductase family protein [Dictyoglomaceae bacterium]HPP15811.1 flavin reductase family protein [Dictyoglomaceae bacterium]HPU42800.1 flavin reductase family protein [Dictyoglomaceae bacterium]